MIYAQPGTSFEATTDWGFTVPVGALGVTILDNVGGTTRARTPTGVLEIADGIYATTLTAPDEPGQYSIVWDDGTSVAQEDLTVPGTAGVPDVPGPPTTIPVSGMSFAELRAAVYERRFPSSAPVDSWLQAAYTEVWNVADGWSFKNGYRQAWWTTADGTQTGQASATPPMFAGFADATGVYDDQGAELDWLPQHDFEQQTAEATPTTGRSLCYTVINRQVVLWPKPAAAYPFTVSYRRAISTRDASGLVHSGFATADTDYPMWNDHHWVLVVRAKMFGLRDRSDPTSADLVDDYERLLEAMRNDFLTTLPRGYQLPAYR